MFFEVSVHFIASFNVWVIFSLFSTNKILVSLRWDKKWISVFLIWKIKSFIFNLSFMSIEAKGLVNCMQEAALILLKSGSEGPAWDHFSWMALTSLTTSLLSIKSKSQSILKYWFNTSYPILLDSSCFIDDRISYIYDLVSLKVCCAATLVICDPFFTLVVLLKFKWRCDLTTDPSSAVQLREAW